jgi:tRNA-dihydrouridine synthase B
VKNLYHPVRIAGFTVPGNFFLAPVAGFSDRAFRSICIRYGADFTYTEMVSAEALARDSGKTLELMEPAENEHIFSIQLFASNPESAAKAVRHVVRFNPAVIDLNCGCPVPKVIKTGAGAALMRNPGLIGRIVSAIVGETDIPVTVKIRSGWDASELTYLEAAGKAVSAGAAAVGFHPRTRSQGYGGRADWSLIGGLKRAIPVPVIGSGDLFRAQDALEVLERTGCDAVMFARGAIGNPFIFREARALATGTEHPEPAGIGEKIAAALDHLTLAVENLGEPLACREMRKHICAYTKGIEGGSELRNRVIHAVTLEEYRSIFNEYLGRRGETRGLAG